MSGTVGTTGTSTGTSSTIASLSKTAASTSLAASSAGTSSLNLDSSEWLTLLTAELKYQDPNSPSDPTQFVAQLATFSMVSEQNQSNTTLSSISSQLTAGSLGQTAGMIGRSATGPMDSYVVPSSGSASTANISYAVTDSTLSNVQLQVKNALGTVVSTSAISASSGTISFDGTTASGSTLPAGSYTLGLVGTDSSGTTSTAGTLSTSGVVTQVLQNSSGGMDLQLDNGSTVSSSAITALGSS